MRRRQIFLLSPASCGGKRAALLFNDRAEFDIAKRVRSEEGAPLGEVFSFLSGLYFRGKITYARMFENPPPRRASGVHIITPTDATGKYVDVLQPIFGDRLLFPQEFVGHGDMARGGILLQRAASGVELTYIPVSNPSRLGIRATKKARAQFDARLEANP